MSFGKWRPFCLDLNALNFVGSWDAIGHYENVAIQYIHYDVHLSILLRQIKPL